MEAEQLAPYLPMQISSLPLKELNDPFVFVIMLNALNLNNRSINLIDDKHNFY
jgi:hypothetical protein